ncbi:hypothetical protein ACFWZ2_08550 [Streptomyces sp. NPDC059002]|uniref:hypothetical protein n=1 Tax=Streptomyces sp. NPDC059002 TaxID=3346690 RepID=UPI003692EB5B
MLIVLGWMSRGVGLLTVLSFAVLTKPLFLEPIGPVEQLPLSSRGLIYVAVLLGGWLLFQLGTRQLVRGKRHLVETIVSFDQLVGVRYVLYLRPFVLDPVMARPPLPDRGWYRRSPWELPGLTQEEFLVQQFAGLGRMVAIGRPGEALPLLGAQRGYLPPDDWQTTVGELLGGAHVVMLSAAPGPGTVWEFIEALRIVDPARLVLLVCCAPAEYDAFRRAVVAAYTERAAHRNRNGSGEVDGRVLPLPDLPPFLTPDRRPGRQWNFQFKGVVVFDGDWRARFLAFDPDVPRWRWVWTMRRVIRRELEPVTRPLSQLPPPAPRRGRPAA